MEILIRVAQLFLAFTILIGIHELGHFLMARLFKIRVEKFYIFFDPYFSLFKFKRGDTEYGVGWLPLGGYVKIAGMIDESMDKEQMAQPIKEDEFRAKPAWQRFLVMIAGVVMNLILAIIIYCGISYVWGDDYYSNKDMQWGYNFNTEAKALGFVDGDRFVTIDGEEVDNVDSIIASLIIADADKEVVVERSGEFTTLNIPLDSIISIRQNKAYETLFSPRMPFIVDSIIFDTATALHKGDEIVAIDKVTNADYTQYATYIRKRAGNDVSIKALRGSDTVTLTLPITAEGRLGVISRSPITMRIQRYTLLEAIPAGFKRAGKTITDHLQQLKKIAQPKSKLYEEVGGFISIGSIFPTTWNWELFWMRTALISILLAIMNILPIPGLDGGHAIFTFWEMVTGRKVSDKVLEVAQYVGLVIILALLIYANGNDIYRFFIK